MTCPSLPNWSPKKNGLCARYWLCRFSPERMATCIDRNGKRRVPKK